MKKLFGTAILLIVAMTVHAGGAGEPQTGGTNSEPASAQTGSTNSGIATAAQLAAALNAMNEGSARVNGDTVTLTKSTAVQRNLTVPAGVTLELAGDGALWLGDNVTLTVNGTMNAPDNSIGTVGEARSMTINGNGTINLTGKGRLLITNGKKITLDGVTLVGVSDNDSALVIVNGGELVMVSGAIRGNTNINGSGGGVFVGNGGTFTMSGGTITGNTAKDGGGVRVDWERGTFTMTGGEITGNRARESGGGSVRTDRGTFTMLGGFVEGIDPAGALALARELNAIQEGSATASVGDVTLTSGVRIENATLIVPANVTLDLTMLQLGNNAVLTVNGTVTAGGTDGRTRGIVIDSAMASPATINGNGTINLKGGGTLIYARERKVILDGVTLVGVDDNPDPLVVTSHDGEIIMKSGVITGNTNIINGHGGGVHLNTGTFIMEGGAITGNNGKGAMTGGVVVFQGVFTMKGGVISGNIGGGVFLGGWDNTGGGTFIMEGGTIYGSTAEGGNANTAEGRYPNTAALRVNATSTARWGTGGTYTRGGVNQSGGGNITSTNDTLIAIPAR